MGTSNFLLAFNGLGLLWLSLGIISLALVAKASGTKKYWWLLILTGTFTITPLVLLFANFEYPLSTNSKLFYLIIVLIVISLINLYFHTLDLLSIKISKKRVIFSYLAASLLLLTPSDLLSIELEKFDSIIRTIAFHSTCIILLILSAKNLKRLEKQIPSPQIKITKILLSTMAILFSCRVFYGLINPQYLIINPHEQVDFVFFLIRLLLVVFAGLSLVFLISIHQFHLINVNPLSKHISTSEYDVSVAINERNQLIDSLLKANKTLSIGAVSSGLAHELNQPLSALNINIALLKRELSEKLPESTSLESIKDIEKSIERASNIIQNVSSLSHTNKAPSEKYCSLKKTFEDVLEITKHDLQNNQIQLKIQITDCAVVIQKSELEQVLLNIISNAITALKNIKTENRVIEINTENKPGKVCQIEISNNGGLIDEELAQELFALPISKSQNGMGIGLWISKYILDKNSSKIDYLAITPNIAKFVITIPINLQINQQSA